MVPLKFLRKRSLTFGATCWGITTHQANRADGLCTVDACARGCEIVKEYSSREIIVLNLTNFPQNGRSRLLSELFSTKKYSYYTSSLFSFNFSSDGYLDHSKNPCWNYLSIFFITPLFFLCAALIVWHLVERGLRGKKRFTPGKVVYCAWVSGRVRLALRTYVGVQWVLGDFPGGIKLTGG